jgi:anthranilate synthase
MTSVLFIDNFDSFTFNLVESFERLGCDIKVLRNSVDAEVAFALALSRGSLIVLSPGPGTPRDFDVAGTLEALVRRRIPAFGVCLGLQGMVEHFGGALGVLDTPVHGKASRIRVVGGRLFAGLPAEFTAGRYHSLFALRERLPAVLEVTAESEDGVVMAIEHATLPLAAVQFHPESIMTLEDDLGLRLLANVVERLASAP